MRFEPVPAVSVSGTRTSASALVIRPRRRGKLRRAAAGATVQALESRTMLSASLVKDINTTNTDANPQNFFVFNGEIYFNVNGGQGNWKTDGTVAGTQPGRLSLIPGAPDAVISDPTVVNGLLYFFARGPSDGKATGLWKSDGTVAGTTEVATFNGPADLANADGTLYFLDYDYAYLTTELWRSDGTAAGTVPLTGFGEKGPSPTDLTGVGDRLYFSYVNSLWTSDGTPAGTIRVPVNAPPPGNMVDFNGRLFYSGAGSLWESDGTAAGTYQVFTQPFLNVGRLQVYDGSLYFGAGGYTPYALWKTDGTAAGTAQVTAIPNGTSQPSLLTVANGTLYFSAGDSVHGVELWRSDGTATGTMLVKDIDPGPADGVTVKPANTAYLSPEMIAFDGKVFFDATDRTHGVELWESDGTAAGTFQLGQINTTTVGSDFGSAVTIGGITYFSANDGVHGNEVWRTDGTAAGTFMVADLTPGPWTPSLYVVRGTLYIDAYDGTQSNLYVSDGTAAGTRLIGPGLGTWNDLTPIGNSVYFVADVPGSNLNAVYVTDGTAAGTRQVTEALKGGVGPIANLNGVLYFIAYDAGYHPSLWQTDGTAAGTTEVTAFAGTGWGGNNFAVDGSELYFGANDGVHGFGVWKSDGTAAGTSMVWGSGSSDLAPAYLYTFDGAIYFTVESVTGAVQASGVFKTDGTTAGTVELTADTAVTGFTAAAGQLFFAARPPGTYDMVPTATDGTPDGTRTIGAGSQLFAVSMMAIDGQLYFLAYGPQGTQLWQTDGTTTALADPSGPANGWTPDMLLGQVAGGLVFAATDLAHGSELWDLPLGQFADGGFESPQVGAGTFGAFAYAPADTGWTFTPQSGANGSGVTGNGSGFTAQNPNAPEGSQAAFLQGDGTMSQSVDLAAGTYAVSFLAAQRVQWQSGRQQDFQVLVDGAVAGTFVPPSGGAYWGCQAGPFTVTAGPHTIMFKGLDTAGGDNTAFVDDARVVAAVPAPVLPANAGFESPSVGSGTFYAFAYDPTNAGWAFAGNAGITGNGSGFTAQNPDAPEGGQVGFLQFAGSTISQSLTLAAGTYVVNFQAAQRVQWQYGRQDFQVLVDGAAVGTFKPASGTYAGYSTGAFAVAAGAHTIAFAGLDTAGGDNTAFIDAVRVVAAPGQPADAGFESPVVGTGAFASFQYDPSGSPWAFAGHAGLSGNGSGFTALNSNAPEGAQAAFLQFGDSSISQSLSLAAGAYAITFDAAQRVIDQSAAQDFQVLVDGAVVGTFQPPASGAYTAFQTTAFAVTTGAHTITFKALDTAGGDNTAFIDAVTVVYAGALNNALLGGALGG